MQRTRHLALSFVFFLTVLGTATASELTVKISGLDSTEGIVGCALFAAGEAERFPSDGAETQKSIEPDIDGVVCRFEDVVAGRYAVSVSHDLNRNGKVDTRAFGIPKEPWGVSNGVRPRLRAPRFEKAAFDVGDDELKEIEVTVR